MAKQKHQEAGAAQDHRPARRRSWTPWICVPDSALRPWLPHGSPEGSGRWEPPQEQGVKTASEAGTTPTQTPPPIAEAWRVPSPPGAPLPGAPTARGPSPLGALPRSPHSPGPPLPASPTAMQAGMLRTNWPKLGLAGLWGRFT